MKNLTVSGQTRRWIVTTQLLRNFDQCRELLVSELVSFDEADADRVAYFK